MKVSTTPTTTSSSFNAPTAEKGIKISIQGVLLGLSSLLRIK